MLHRAEVMRIDRPSPPPPRPVVPKIAAAEPLHRAAQPPSPVRAVRPAIQAPPPSSPNRPEKPEPSIHVTIGRVEVRAVPAPVRERAPSHTPRGLSLEDYLRQRARGGTR